MVAPEQTAKIFQFFYPASAGVFVAEKEERHCRDTVWRASAPGVAHTTPARNRRGAHTVSLE